MSGDASRAPNPGRKCAGLKPLTTRSSCEALMTNLLVPALANPAWKKISIPQTLVRDEDLWQGWTAGPYQEAGRPPLGETGRPPSGKWVGPPLRGDR